jgi:hypothetical protein
MNDAEIRDLLTRVADEVRPTPVDPEPLLRRGYRRMARTAIACSIGIAFAIAVVIGGVGLISPSAPTTTPADDGQRTSTWTGPCLDSQDGPPGQVCLGPLEEGTYTSQRFEPALTFTVPAGWNNPWDTRSGFRLWAPGWSDESYLLDSPGLGVRRDPRPDEGCVDAVDPTVGTSAIEIATWVANHPAISTKPPSPVEIGGLSGYQLDVSLADTWQKSCPGDAVWLFADIYLRDPDTMRLILLDLPDSGSVLIAIDENRLDVAMPVVESFVFDMG